MKYQINYKKHIIIKMEHYKISRLLKDSTALKFVTKNFIEANDLSSGQYSVNKNIGFKNSMLRLGLCDDSDAYIVLKRRYYSVTDTNNANRRNKKTNFKE